MNETIYPIYIVMNSKNVQIGSAKVSFENPEIADKHKPLRWEAILKGTQLLVKENDCLCKVFGSSK